MLSDLRNVYYHTFQRCVKAKVHDFDAQNDLKISAGVKKQAYHDSFKSFK